MVEPIDISWEWIHVQMSTFDELLQLEYLVHWLFLPELCFTYPCHGIVFPSCCKGEVYFHKVRSIRLLLRCPHISHFATSACNCTCTIIYTHNC